MWTSVRSCPEPGALAGFKAELEREGVNVTVRRRLGGDIDASCGQLRKKSLRLGDRS